MKHILVTGGAGFIGSNFIPYMLEKYKDYTIVNIDALTYAGNTDNVHILAENKSRYVFVAGNICDEPLVNSLFEKYDIRGVFHFAAESHVDNSITGPKVFFETNVMGTYNVVHAAKTHWMDAPFKFKKDYEDCRFHHVSTDEVYGTLGYEGLFSETTAYAPNPPYAASKAGADFVIRSYFHTFGMPVTISNCSNNYGPNQHDEKFIPTVIRSALSGKNIPIYGTGANIRDWLYVLDHGKGLDNVFHNGRIGETYNIGCWNEQTNNTIVHMICDTLDRLKPKSISYKELITYVEDRAGHDMRYAIDSTKIENELGWKADETFAEALEETIKWYIQKYDTQLHSGHSQSA
ncbi:MAG: dTDP-glucose 4,6-dehydratase [Alphaproteobacteria bacterium]|jgi:dTDP-glucose 4,6-dehydratase